MKAKPKTIYGHRSDLDDVLDSSSGWGGPSLHFF